MSKASTLASSLAFILAAVFSIAVAVAGVLTIEDRSTEAVEFSMREVGLDWVEVSANGLEVTLTGTAPDEAARFRALSRAGAVVDADRIIDLLEVTDPAGIEAPDFVLEMLRNGDGISLIGLIPADLDGYTVAESISDITRGVEVVNMVETVAYPIPDGWTDALEYGLTALRELPRAKVSVFEGRVLVEAVSDSPEQRARLLRQLETAQPSGLEVTLDISAPRPVITPFTLRFVRDTDGGYFEACSADTVAAQVRILRAAQAAGMTEEGTCDIGIGVPTPQWGDAVETALEALTELGQGSITFSDADVTLIAAEGTSQSVYDRVVGELDNDLPAVFSLHSVLPALPDGEEAEGPPNFTATRSPEGLVQLRGRLPNDRMEEAVLAYANAQFGRDNTYLATRIDEALPEGWPLRVLAGLEGLSHLNNGSLTVEPSTVILRGASGSQTAVRDLTLLLSEKLGAAEDFQIDVRYDEMLDPEANIPEPDECVAQINAILDVQKITFDPGSIEINEASGLVLDEIAEILPDCRHVRMEIGGHTDSQGREEMNLSLSQARADAVLNGLLAREVLVSNLSAQGYGETQPIADNETEAGRETNRRIEFRLLASGTAATEEEDDISTDDATTSEANTEQEEVTEETAPEDSNE